MKYTFQDIDERIIKTKDALFDAVLTLLKQNKKIKVLDICHKAKITPMTYYHHFDNKEQLMECAIKEQLIGILPIPNKLKPVSLKHLVYYLINSFGQFINKNHDLIYCSLNHIQNHSFKNSYLFFVLKISISLVEKELGLLLGYKNISISLINSIICGAILNAFIQMIIRKTIVNSSMIWSSFKTINVLLN